MSATNRSNKRHKDDAYSTPKWLTRALMGRLNLSKDARILEPACGTGSIVEVLREQDYRNVWIGEKNLVKLVRCSRRYGCPVASYSDYLAFDESNLGWDLIVTNPPYTLALEFIQKSFKLSSSLWADHALIAMLLRVNFVGSGERAEFHNEHPSELLVTPRRPSFTYDGKTDATEYAWFVWGTGQEGTWHVFRPHEVYPRRCSGSDAVGQEDQGHQRDPGENPPVALLAAPGPDINSNIGQRRWAMQGVRRGAWFGGMPL